MYIYILCLFFVIIFYIHMFICLFSYIGLTLYLYEL